LSNVQDRITGWHEAVPLNGKLLCVPGRGVLNTRDSGPGLRLPTRF